MYRMDGVMSHRKWRETKQHPSMLPGQAGPDICLVSFCFLCDIHSIHSVDSESSESRLRLLLRRPHENVGDLHVLGRLEYVLDVVRHVLGLQTLDRLVEGLRLALAPLVHREGELGLDQAGADLRHADVLCLLLVEKLKKEKKMGDKTWH